MKMSDEKETSKFLLDSFEFQFEKKNYIKKRWMDSLYIIFFFFLRFSTQIKWASGKEEGLKVPSARRTGRENEAEHLPCQKKKVILKTKKTKNIKTTKKFHVKNEETGMSAIELSNTRLGRSIIIGVKPFECVWIAGKHSRDLKSAAG